MTNPYMTIIRDGWRLCLEYPSSYSRQPRLGLATYSLFVSLVCLSFFLSVCLFVCLSSTFLRYTLTILCVQVVYVLRQNPIDFGAN